MTMENNSEYEDRDKVISLLTSMFVFDTTLIAAQTAAFLSLGTGSVRLEILFKEGGWTIPVFCFERLSPAIAEILAPRMVWALNQIEQRERNISNGHFYQRCSVVDYRHNQI